MIIDPKAVKAFLERDLPDLSLIKRRSKAELRRRVRKLKPRPRFKTQLYKHQLATFLLMARFPSLGVWLDMGGGKTMISLASIAWRIQRGDIKRAIVLVPLAANLIDWADEIEKHSDLSYVVLDFPGQDQRIAALESDAQVIVMTYVGFLRLVSYPVTKKVRGKKKTAYEPDLKLCRMLGREFGMWICDEATFLRNHEAGTWRALNKVFKFAKYRYFLTGTPYGGDPEELWPQFRLMDGGVTLGKTLGLFRAAFCTAEEVPFSPYPRWTFKRRMTRKLRKMVKSRSLRYKDSEMTDLPPLVGGIVSKRGPMVRRVTFSNEQWAYYQKLIEELEAARGSFHIVENAFLRMRCLAAGFLPVIDPEGIKLSVKFKDNPKLDALVGLLREVDADRKVIVACVHKVTGELICERLRQERMKPVRIFSGTAKKQRESALKRFRKGDARILVASEAIAFGMNLQAASVIVIYESPLSPITRRQLEKRIHRHGQKRRCYIYDLIIKGSVEEAILGALKSGRDLFEELVEGRKRITLSED